MPALMPLEMFKYKFTLLKYALAIEKTFKRMKYQPFQWVKQGLEIAWMALAGITHEITIQPCKWQQLDHLFMEEIYHISGMSGLSSTSPINSANTLDSLRSRVQRIGTIDGTSLSLKFKKATEEIASMPPCHVALCSRNFFYIFL